MFTGIVQGIAEIISIEEKHHLRTHIVQFPPEALPNLQLGASVSHNGCCLTVTKIEADHVSFDLMKETLCITNLGELKVGDKINFERAAKFGDEIGGHLMSGHIATTAMICKIIRSENNCEIWFELSDIAAHFMKFILPKGFVGIDGISLTVGEVNKNKFCVHLIPETWVRTTLGSKKFMQYVNIEIDSQTQAIVETVERVLTNMPSN